MTDPPKSPIHGYQSFLVRMWRHPSDEKRLMAWEGDLHHLQENRVYMFHGIGELMEHLLHIIFYEHDDQEV